MFTEMKRWHFMFTEMKRWHLEPDRFVRHNLQMRGFSTCRCLLAPPLVSTERVSRVSYPGPLNLARAACDPEPAYFRVLQVIQVFIYKDSIEKCHKQSAESWDMSIRRLPDCNRLLPGHHPKWHEPAISSSLVTAKQASGTGLRM